MVRGWGRGEGPHAHGPGAADGGCTRLSYQCIQKRARGKGEAWSLEASSGGTSKKERGSVFAMVHELNG